MLEKFLLYSTGAVYPQPNSIRIRFMDDDQHGAITSHTCSKVLVFPSNLFAESYEVFSASLTAVISSDNSFNTV